MAHLLIVWLNGAYCDNLDWRVSQTSVRLFPDGRVNHAAGDGRRYWVRSCSQDRTPSQRHRSYVNAMSESEDAWARSAYGVQYARQSRLKASYVLQTCSTATFEHPAR